MKLENVWQTKQKIFIYRLLAGRSNVFLVKNDQVEILIDSSWKLARPRLKRALTKLNYSQEKSVCVLFLTHAHFDHAENAAWVQNEYHPHVIIHQSECDFLKAGRNSKIAGSNKFIRRLFPSLIQNWLNSTYRYPITKPEITFTERLELQDFGMDATILHTPGHTQGSSSLIINDEIAIVGDAMHGVFPNTAFPPFAVDNDQLIASWGKLLKTRCRLFLPSHGNALQRERIEQEYLSLQ
jgi:glyoxylase-like metal-dependent hydrolase (beta-lactamase superfamily II)